MELVETVRAQVDATRAEAGFVSSVSDYMPDISHRTNTKPVIVAGVEIDQIDSVDVTVAEFSLFGTPPMVDRAVEITNKLIELEERLKRDQATLDILEEEFDEVSRQLAVFEAKFVPWLEESVRKVKQRISDSEALGAGIAGKVKKRHAASDAEEEENTAA